MNIRILYLLVVVFLLASCKNDFRRQKSKAEIPDKVEGNIYQDPILQDIYNYQDQRNSTELLKFLNNDYPEYRKAAILAFASVQDSSVVMPLATLFSDEVAEIRSSVAYVLGQIGHKSAEPILIETYKNEQSLEVKKNILEALGKCGTDKGLNFIASLHFKDDNLIMNLGQAWGLSRFAMRGIYSKQSTDKALEMLLSNQLHEKIRFTISHYFARCPYIDLSRYHQYLLKAFNSGGYLYTKINITKALAKSQNIHTLDFFYELIKGNYDYRIKINAIRGCRSFKYNESREIMFETLLNEDAKVSNEAALFFLNKGIEEDADKYFSYSKQVNNWRARTNLLAASLKYAKDKRNISNSIKSGFEVTENIYEKAALLEALEGNPMEYKFVENQTFYSNNTIISTSGIQTLVNMRKHPDFEKYSNQIQVKTKDNLYDDFILNIKKAIQSKDVAMVTIAATALQDTTLGFKNAYTNTYFINQAISNCQLPQDIEAYAELTKALKVLTGEQKSIPDLTNQYKIDWNLVTSISPEQKVIIETTKGSITIQLMVNKAPVSVANFIKLVKDNYYNGSTFHRVVPGFVIQDGCKRGDGWGSANYAIRSEFPPLYYEEGSVGMASAGKDTESAQWFITQEPTAHLDGRYTIFGTVIDGMDNVHKIEVGDKILKMEIQ